MVNIVSWVIRDCGWVSSASTLAVHQSSVKIFLFSFYCSPLDQSENGMQKHTRDSVNGDSAKKVNLFGYYTDWQFIDLDPEDCCYHCSNTNYSRDLKHQQRLLRYEISMHTYPYWHTAGIWSQNKSGVATLNVTPPSPLGKKGTKILASGTWHLGMWQEPERKTPGFQRINRNRQSLRKDHISCWVFTFQALLEFFFFLLIY